MKKALILSVLLLGSVALFAENETTTNGTMTPQSGFEQQTLMGNNPSAIGFGVDITVRGSFINNQLFPSLGGDLVAIINHNIMIGIGGYGVLMGNNLSMSNIASSNINVAGIGWGGLVLGYSFIPELVIHPYIKALIGMGGFGNYMSSGNTVNGLMFFVLDGEVGAEMNVFKWFRVCPYIGYHLLTGNDPSTVNLSGWQFGVNAKFGIF